MYYTFDTLSVTFDTLSDNTYSFQLMVEVSISTEFQA